jgi:pimeloyl-ACP methyl ester carboxylesterase
MTTPDPTPIILLHGAGVTQKWWHPQIDALSDEFRVIAPDLAGHGARGSEPFTLSRAVEDLSILIDSQAGGQAIVCGISLGGYIAMAHAGQHPDQTAGLVLAGCSMNLNGLRGLAFKMTGLMLKIQGVEKITDGTLRGFRKRVRPEIIEPVIEAGLNIETAMGAFGQVAGRNYFKLMAGYSRPVVIVNGVDDELSRKGEEKLLKALPNGGLEVIEGAGHLVNLEQPEAFNALLRDFAIKAQESSINQAA